MPEKILFLPLLLLFAAGCSEKIEGRDVSPKTSGDVPRRLVETKTTNTPDPPREEPNMVTPVALD